MSGNFTGLGLVVILLSLIISLVIHEFMHGYVGYLLGDTTAKDEGRLSLNPLRHIDPYMTVLLPIVTLLFFHVPILAAKPVPFNPSRVKYDEFGAALIAAAGPFSNLVLAILAALISSALGAPHPGSDSALGIFIDLNVLLFVFNMIPIPPLDGSRVLYAFAPEPLQEFMRDIEPYGLLIVFALVFLGALGGLLTSINQFILNHLP